MILRVQYPVLTQSHTPFTAVPRSSLQLSLAQGTQSNSGSDIHAVNPYIYKWIFPLLHYLQGLLVGPPSLKVSLEEWRNGALQGSLQARIDGDTTSVIVAMNTR